MNRYQSTLGKVGRPYAIHCWKSLFREIRERYSSQTAKSGRIREVRKNGTVAYRIGGSVVVFLEDNNTIFIDRSMISEDTVEKLGVV